MLDRLKSLPLTILLTLLIWMYAESQVNSARTDTTLTLSNIPVLVIGPPEVFSQNNIAVEPKLISVSVSGSPQAIDSLHPNNPKNPGIYAYLDITPEDQPSAVFIYRHIRFVAPAGVTIRNAPEVGFHLTQKSAPTP